MDALNDRKVENRLLVAIFVAALLLHVWLVTRNFQVPFLSGHEFRQSQTALIAYYIDQQNNFSPLYEQPILGKPWIGFMLEFPLYQWCVVGLSRATGWEHHIAARVISLASFYAALPALALLLGRMGLGLPRRLFVLALLLCCPVYIYYTRAFLIDAMAWMFGAWFVAAFVRTMDRRSVGWLAVAIAAGTGAALVKSFILAIWLWPAAAYGAWMLWRDLRAGEGWRRPARTVAWGLGTVLIPLGALKWWLDATDALKEAHPSAFIFTSKNLSVGNWGLFRFDTLFSREVWSTLTTRWSEALMTPWLLLALVAAAMVALPTVRWRVASLAGVFFLSQILFPYAYAYQDYYYYSCGVFIVAALAWAALGLLDTRWPRLLVWVLIAVPFAAQMRTYWSFYRDQQLVWSMGRSTLTMALEDVTPPGSVIVIAGADWAPMIPYYSQRRALMIRNGLEYNNEYLDRAYRDLADEDVAALIVVGKTREYLPFIRFTSDRLDIDPVPTFRNNFADVYLRRSYVRGADIVLHNSRRYGEETVWLQPPAAERAPIAVPPAMGRTVFKDFSPSPYLADLEFGLVWSPLEDEPAISAHADSTLWFRPPPQAQRIETKFGLVDLSWKKEGDKTNGVEFSIIGEVEGGPERVIYRRLLDPANNPADRGGQIAVIDYTPRPGEVLRVSSLANGSKAFDWAYWRYFRIK